VKSPRQETSVGGQAVVEGVMIRAPHATSVAVRRADGSIVVRVRAARRLAESHPWLGSPGTRGVAVLLETLLDGMSALNFSAAQAMPEGEGDLRPPSTGAIVGTMAFALAFGFFLFAILPHLATLALGSLLGREDLAGGRAVAFHLVDGVVKVLVFLCFVWGISRMKDMRRVFEFHGAEHQAVHAHEAGLPLSPETLSRFPKEHARCGTAFVITVIAVSIVVFAAVFPFMPVLSDVKALNQAAYVLIKAPLVLPIAALSYEMIRFAGRREGSLLARALAAPGVLFQKITTQPPDGSQQEIAIVAVETALRPADAGVGPTNPEAVVSFRDFAAFRQGA